MIRRDQIQIRDPYVFVEDSVYYLFGTTDADPWSGKGMSFLCYRSSDLEWFEGPFVAFAPAEGFWADKNFWAPEVHKYKNAYYMFASFYREGRHRGTQILAADQPVGPYHPLADDPYTPKKWDCLDGTFYEEDGRLYSVFAHEWTQIGDGTMELAELSSDLLQAVGEPQTLFHGSDAPWVRSLREHESGYVTDGPFLWKMECGKIAMLWSSFGKDGYALGVAYSANGVHGPWIQEEHPLFSKDGGHGMIFKRPDGQLMIAMHYPNRTPEERACFIGIKERNGRICIPSRA